MATDSISLQLLDFEDSTAPQVLQPPATLAAARNEWIDLVIRIPNLPKPNGVTHLYLTAPTLTGGSAIIHPDRSSFYQILPMPVDCDRAGYVRHTGLTVATRQLPRALLPLPTNAENALDLALLHDSSGQPTIWIDLHIPPDSPAADYTGTLNLTQDGVPQPLASLPITLTVFNFALPAQRHLQMVGQVDWDSLRRLYPNESEAITPRLINRVDTTYAPIVHVLDQFVSAAEENRSNLVVQRLQPTVKWAPAEPPRIDWDDYDSLISPWLSGDAFPDQIGLGYCPIPEVDYLYNYDPASRQQYWNRAAAHFDQHGWLDRSSVFLHSSDTAASAALALASHPLVRVTVPFGDDQLILSQIDPHSFDRLDAASPGLVYSPNSHPWPAGAPQPHHWLRTDLPGLVPYAGAGADERDVRLWAWLAFLRGADAILWTGALPTQDNPSTPADPTALTWFYPGSWFGVSQPVPSIQLKWLRRAQQDYEYLWLAHQRGQSLNALIMARLITRQVEISADQDPDPVYTLLSGTTGENVCDEARLLLARAILLGDPNHPPTDADSRALSVAMQEWQAPKERPYLIPRTVDWSVDPQHDGQINVAVGIDVYNASDRFGEDANITNSLSWQAAGSGWEFQPEPAPVPPLQTYHVQRLSMQANYNLPTGAQPPAEPLTAAFEDGYTHQVFTTQLMLPVAASDRREGGMAIDGHLDDWFDADLIQNGKLICALDRPTLEKQSITRAQTPSQIYTAWSDEDFYVAFRLQGLSPRPSTVSNTVDYQFRRAWGDDLCEVLVQAVYDDNTLGPVVHVICKPNAPILERKLPGSDWSTWDGSPVRYAATLDASAPTNVQWSGELAIPWKTLVAPGKDRPRLLRFNFTQHQSATGQTASWAGPIDYGRDDRFMGLLYLRQSRPIGPN